jgi:hypothetical protein
VAELNGFILFAAVSKENHEMFLKNMRDVVNELSKQ